MGVILWGLYYGGYTMGVDFPVPNSFKCKMKGNNKM